MTLLGRRLPLIGPGESIFGRTFKDKINDVAEVAYDFAQLHHDIERVLTKKDATGGGVAVPEFDAQLVAANQVVYNDGVNPPITYKAFWGYTYQEVYAPTSDPFGLFPVFVPVPNGRTGICFNRIEYAHILPPNDPADPRYVWGVDLEDPSITATLTPLPVGGGGSDPTVQRAHPIVRLRKANSPSGIVYLFEAMGSFHVSCNQR